MAGKPHNEVHGGTQSLKGHLIRRVAGFTALAMLLLTLVVAVMLYQVLQRQALEDLVQQGVAVQTLLEQRVAYLQENTERLVSNPLVINGLLDPQGRETYLPEIAENFAQGRDVLSFGLVDFDGRPVFQHGTQLPDYNSMRELRTALARARLTMFMRADDQELVIVAPIEYYDTTQGAVVVAFDLEAIMERNRPHQAGTFLTLLLGEAPLISRGLKPEARYVRARLKADDRTPRLEEMGLGLEIGQLESTTLKLMWRMILQFLGIGLLMILGAVVVSIWIGNSIARPILTLYHRVRRSGKDDSVQCSPLGTGNELENLALAFDQRTEALRKAHAELERRVEERTLELTVAKEELEESRATLVKAQEIARLGNWVWDFSNGTFSLSKELGRILTVDSMPGSLTWTDFLQAVHPDDRNEVDTAVRRAANDPDVPFDLEHRILGRDGKVRHVQHSGNASFDTGGKPLRMLGTVLDISQRKKSEIALQDAMNAAEAANRAKTVFLANMSHELRTPMNAILGFAQLMQRDAGLTPAQRENLKTINRSGDHLLALINDVLEISRIETGRTELIERPFDFLDMLDSVEEMIRVRAEAKNLTLRFERVGDLPHYVEGDEHKLRQVLINLLGNAVKFTDAGTVTLRVTVGRPEPEKVPIDFAVEDSGIGIAPEDQPRVFEPFTQSEAGEKRGEGTGLGLTISREFVRLLGGELRLESVPAQGSVFRFTVPLSVVEAPVQDIGKASRKVTGLAPGQPTYRVLIVEDKRDNRLLLRQLLEQAGFQVREAVNGEEAITVFHQWHPHLIWMDMRMPVLDGYEATRRIKATPAGKDTVVIALTASAFKEDRGRILHAGCDDFMRKPLDVQRIFDLMSKHLKIEYSYADSDGIADETQGIRLNKARVQRLPLEIRRALGKAAVELDTDTVRSLIEEIAAIDSGLSSRFELLVKEFRFDELHRLVDIEGGDPG